MVPGSGMAKDGLGKVAGGVDSAVGAVPGGAAAKDTTAGFIPDSMKFW